MIQFNIILTTFNRKKLTLDAIESVINQSYIHWKLIVIDDGSKDDTQGFLGRNIKDDRIIYIKHEFNKGYNGALNTGLENIESDCFVVFLDSDDKFNRNCLKEATKVILKHKKYNYFISNRVYTDGKKISNIPVYNKEYNYYHDYFIPGKISGDTVHFLNSNIIKNIRFSQYSRNYHQSLFFLEISQEYNFYTYNFDSTICEYIDGGLTKIDINSGEKRKEVLNFIKDILYRQISFSRKIYILKFYIPRYVYFLPGIHQIAQYCLNRK